MVTGTLFRVGMMAKFKQFIAELKDMDSGFEGKTFEKVLVKGLRMAGLDFKENIANGPGWDIQTKGSGWNRLIDDSDVNIKVAGTKWMVSMAELYTLLPWDKLPENYDSKKYEAKVKRLFNKKGVADIVFLKPKTKDIQNRIIEAVKNNNKDELEKLFVKKNFYSEKLGKGYDVRVLDNGERVTSIALDKGGKVFMRSEKPRKIGGSYSVTFRTPTTKLGKQERNVKKD